MEIILWLLSWIYINFPLCHLNKARIPVGIKIFATPSFYDREESRREVAPQRFLFKSKSASHAEVAPLCFYFRIHFPFSRYRRGQRSCHVLFSPHIRHPTRATRERNSTASAPFSPSLLDEGITRAVVTKKWRSWRVCIQNEDVHIARNSYFKFNTPKLVISYWNESLVVPSFLLSSASSENFPLR